MKNDSVAVACGYAQDIAEVIDILDQIAASTLSRLKESDSDNGIIEDVSEAVVILHGRLEKLSGLLSDHDTWNRLSEANDIPATISGIVDDNYCGVALLSGMMRLERIRGAITGTMPYSLAVDFGAPIPPLDDLDIKHKWFGIIKLLLSAPEIETALLRVCIRKELLVATKLQTNKVQHFVPSILQEKILAALHGVAMKKDQLAEKVCGGEGQRLYKNNGIKELMNEGLVVNKTGLGYYRTDSPPNTEKELKCD